MLQLFRQLYTAVLDVLVLVLVLAGIPGSLVLVEEAVYCVLYLHGH